MRKNEVALVQEALRKVGFARLHVEDASGLFFERLKGVYEPEQKRKIIGDTFLDVRTFSLELLGGSCSVLTAVGRCQVKELVANRLKLSADDWLLGQGTIYPGMSFSRVTSFI